MKRSSALDAAPRKGRRPGYVLFAPWRGFLERPWFDALFFFGAAPMVHISPDFSQNSQPIPKLPALNTDTWALVIRTLQLSPQQVKVTSQVLRGLCDKQIASELGIKEPTVRTHLRRIFRRNGLRDRGELILRIFAIAQVAWVRLARHH
ncbi:Bacterial regulatory protein, luxR family [Phycisphaerae bacterium RAS2]|nr:Bacterial regulatory protein, luxR family [Phycisphaerae bacterium RAS2]